MSLSIIDPAPQAANPHQNASFWLDVSDKLIKFVALLIGGAWTWMNFKRSRTYAKKLDLQLAGTVFQRESLFVEITATIKNVGASRHSNVAQPARFSPSDRTLPRSPSDC